MHTESITRKLVFRGKKKHRFRITINQLGVDGFAEVIKI